MTNMELWWLDGLGAMATVIRYHVWGLVAWITCTGSGCWGQLPGLCIAQRMLRCSRALTWLVRALKECRALGYPLLGEQFLQESASSLDAPGRSVAVDAKDSNGDPFEEESTNLQPLRRLPRLQMNAKSPCNGSLEKELLQHKDKDQFASLTWSWQLN